MKNGERAAWSQLTRESSRAYSCFLSYRDAGRNRSLISTYRRATGRSQAVRPSGSWIEWYRRHEWAERARAWDEYQESVLERAISERQREQAASLAEQQSALVQQELEIGRALLDRAQSMLKWPLAQVTRDVSEDGQTLTLTVKPTRWSFDSLARMVDLGDQLVRRSLDLPHTPAELQQAALAARYREDRARAVRLLTANNIEPTDSNVADFLRIINARD